MRKNSGYPCAYWKSLRRFLVGFGLFAFVIFALASFFAYNAIYSDAPLAIAAGLGGISLFLLFVFVSAIRSKPKLALYFEAKVPGDWLWSAPLARNCVFLDELCDSVGVAALSSFGFGDDWSGKKMIWHAPEKGLQTVSALIHQLRARPEWEEVGAITTDLEKMNCRLQTAENRGVRFCFILHEDGINAMEVEQRCGKF